MLVNKPRHIRNKTLKQKIKLVLDLPHITKSHDPRHVVQSKSRYLWIYHQSNLLVGECVVPIASSNDHR